MYIPQRLKRSIHYLPILNFKQSNYASIHSKQLIIERETVKPKFIKNSKSICFSRCLSTKTISLENQHKIQAIASDREYIKVKWETGKECDFPYIFLRDNCQCSKCFDASSKSRIVDIFKNIGLNHQAKSIEKDENKIRIKWDDNHVSEFSSSWLLERVFPKEKKAFTDDVPFGIKRKLWNKEILSRDPPFLYFEDWVRNDECVLKHVELLLTYGVCIVKGVPTSFKDSQFLADRLGIGYNKTTHYGNKYAVTSKADPSNIAFSSGDLSLHNDMGYLVSQPDIQFLYCIEQLASEDESGKSLLVDGFYVAKKLKENERNSYDTLTRTLLPFHDVGNDKYGAFHAYDQKPVLRLDSRGDVVAICYNTHIRSSHIDAPSDDVINIYKALYAFHREINNEENVWQYKLQPGDVLTFHNKRLLHGRKSYDPRTMSRLLEGGYFDWDSLLMKYRVLQSKLNGRYSKESNIRPP